jgi:hypothetical protein
MSTTLGGDVNAAVPGSFFPWFSCWQPSKPSTSATTGNPKAKVFSIVVIALLLI